MWGIIPSAGIGSRIQPLAFSKELLPVGSRFDGETERPKAVSEYLVERMILAGADRICFVISPGKSDILEYYGEGMGRARFCYAVQQKPAGLCDALFRPLAFIPDSEAVLIGLPDTVWYPEDGFLELGDAPLSFLLFPVAQPQFFDAVVCDEEGAVQEIQVKAAAPATNWIWGAIRARASVWRDLFHLWRARERRDAYLGTLVNAYLAQGGAARAVKAGTAYVDVGTFNGYREAGRLLSGGSLPRRPVAAELGLSP